MSFEEIRFKSIRAAQNLQLRGFKEKQIVGFMSREPINFSSILFASFYIGCTITSFDVACEKNELIHRLKIVQPSIMFCEVNVYNLLKECLDEEGVNAKIFTFDGEIADSEHVENLFLQNKDENHFVSVKPMFFIYLQPP